MRFGKYLAKTFLVFAASGLGTSVGVGIGVAGLICTTKKITGKVLKDIETISNHKDDEKTEATA